MKYERTAATDKVLCNGYTCTGLGGTVIAPTEEELYTDWQELSVEEAELLIASNAEDNEATEADYQAALAELGVDLNEEI